MLAMSPIISVSNLSKTYGSGFKALNGINLDINKGEIFALLGPNGAGKTTLISIICGIANLSEGRVTVNGYDVNFETIAPRAALIGLVPQELHTDAFESVWATVSFSRGLFGKPKNPAYIEKVLKDLSLWDKKDAKIVTLSGGMKRRVMIAKALSHQPQILFLDEPTAGVDVELRKGMWEVVRTPCRRRASPSFSPRITSRRPRRWPTGSASSTRARSSWSRTRPNLMQKLGKKAAEAASAKQGSMHFPPIACGLQPRTVRGRRLRADL